ncbi:MAG: TIGR02206 family membrane protein [Nocardioidaceae bacterium]|nr:TIGR02206 family membrane protein [Nocardioidaceae bacterium]
MALGTGVGLASRGFQSFSAEHLVILAVFALGVVAFAVAGVRLRGTEAGTRFTRAFAVTIPVFTVPFQVLQLLPGDFGLGTSLPLQICDLSWMVAVYALWTRDRLAVALLYFWGLTLTVQAIVTPSLDQTFPDPRWFMFWGMHLLTVWASVHLVAAVGGPDWAGFRFTVAVTAVWAVLVMVFNALTDTNYGYLNRKPDTASLLDVLGPWPLYVAVEVVILVAVWALMTWPWQRAAEPRAL